MEDSMSDELKAKDEADEAELLKLEQDVDDVQVSERFKSPAGDLATEFLDKEFTRIEKWIELKLKDGRLKSIILTQLEILHPVIIALVRRALG